MKFKVLFKTPDTLSQSINQVIDQLEITDEDQKHQLTMQLMELAQDYISYGEQVTLEFDTDVGSVRVKQCRRCLKQGDGAVQSWIKDNPGWVYALDSISKVFTFPDFNSAMGFANRVGFWAERNDHHPYLKISWGKVEVTWNTHDAGGVTVRDFAGASATDSYYQQK